MLRIDDLVLGYGGEPVLDGVRLEVSAGSFVSLVGPSGSGKSSILRALTGLQTPLAGTTRIEADAADVGFLFQDDALLPWRTARHNVALGLRAGRGMPKRAALAEADAWLARMGLTGFEDRYPRELSGGQRKRVALAQVLATRPKLLLMDEPFASLDAIVRHRITSDLLAWLEREDVTVLLVTHDLEEAVALSDQVAVLSRGPRARIRETVDVPLPRPRDQLAVRTHPAFAPLFTRLWAALEAEVLDTPKAAELADAALTHAGDDTASRTQPAGPPARHAPREAWRP